MTHIGKIKINSIEWYVPHYRVSVKDQGKLRDQIIDEIPTEFRYVERSVLMKEVNTKKFGVLNQALKKV